MLALFIGIGAMVYYSTRRIVDIDHLVEHTQGILVKLEALESTINEGVTSTRSYVLTGDQNNLDRVAAAKSRAAELVRTLRSLTSDDPSQQTSVQQLEPHLLSTDQYWDRAVALKKAGKPAAANETMSSSMTLQLIRDDRQLIAAMTQEENQLLDTRLHDAETSARRAIVIELLLAGAALSILALSYLFVQMDMNEKSNSLQALSRSEESYRRLVELLPDAMLVQRQGTIVFANSAYISLVGATSFEEIRGRYAFDFVHPQDREVARKRAESLSDTTPLLRAETRMIRLDGKETVVEVVLCTIMYQGEPATQVMYRDIGARRKAEETLRKSEANLTTAQRMAHLGSFEYDLANLDDPERVPLSWSDEVFRIFGYAPGQIEVTRSSFLDAVHPDDRERVRGGTAKAMREGGSYSADCRIVHPNGVERIVHAEADIVRDEATGKPVRMLGTVQDITERKHAEERIRRLAQAVEHSTEFIAMGDCEGRITFANQGLLRGLGYSEEDLIGKTFKATIMSHGGPATLGDQIRRAIFEKGGWRGETLHRRKDGTDVPVYLSMTQLKDSAGGVIGVVGIAQDITEQKKADEKFYKAFNLSPEPTLIATLSEGRYVDVNESFLRVTGYRREEVIGRTSVETKLWGNPESRGRIAGILKEQGSVRDLEIDFLTKSGERRIGLLSADLMKISGEECSLGILEDVTDRKLLEQQFHQAQKMEAIGRLSGGIAHDFNNLLGVIIGYSEVLEDRLKRNTVLRENAKEIGKAAQRAASLTRQLLAFSRQQMLEPKVVNLNAVVSDTRTMLQRLIGEDIELKGVLAPDLGHVKADKGQIEQIIMNLVVNARDAMPHGGKLILETSNVEVDEAFAREHPPVVPGRFVLLTVMDTGIGMDKETQARIFEPFFTTKEKDKGTGLGLAVVYGVVKQSDGYIWVDSELGAGTAFKIYLPRVDEPLEEASPITDAGKSSQGVETILLVEDEESLRHLTRTMLVAKNYDVLEANTGAQALEIARQFKGTIHLLLTDVVLPGMRGPELASKMALAHPEMKVLFVSGYTDYAVAANGMLEAGTFLLQKPFTRDALTRKVREVLDAKVPVKA
jgi:two-component system cell cycle sensor histidine kinase/response regulator CckA